MFKVNDRVYYKYRCGWGGGEIGRAFGVVLKINPKTAVIALYDERACKAVQKRVALTSLIPRPVDRILDATLAVKMRKAGINV